MKSLVRFTATALLSAVMFIGCATTSGVSEFAEKAEECTPENSVVMIFIGHGTFDFVQMNPEYPAERFTVKDNSGCTPPVKPGSCYMNVYLDNKSSENWAGTPSIYGSLPFAYLNAEQTDKFTRGRKFAVPTEPGLYVYYPVIDWEAIKASGALVIGKTTNDIEEWKKSSMWRNYILKRFKNCQKMYAGTAWEPLIEEYVEEWTK